ncbi:MAG: acyl-CoA dehydrogenase family protein [Betaproteobacteria bacterium]
MAELLRTHFDTEHVLFRKGVADWLAREVGPRSADWERDGLVPKAAWRAAGAAGLLCTWADERYGGAGQRDFRYDQIVAEELGRANEAGLALPLHSSIIAPYIDRFGSDEQKARWLTKAVSGEAVLAIAMTEPGAGSDLAGMRTRAVRGADGDWTLSGAKTFISNGINADLVIVAAKPDAENPRRLGLFVVESGMPGFTRGRRLDKLGNRAQDTAELFFDGVRVPAANVLGDPAKGFHALMAMLGDERLTESCIACGMMAGAFDATLAYVKQRQAFGQPIGAFQHVRFRLAELRTEIDCTQAFVDACVMAHVRSVLTPELAAEAKLKATELLGRVVDDGVQFHGGAGVMMETPIARYYANARVHRIWAGSSEIMKEIVGRSLGL